MAPPAPAPEFHDNRAALLALGGKLREDVVFAKREIAFGYFQSKHIHEMHKLFMKILVPIVGFSTITDISERLNYRFCIDMKRPEGLDSLNCEEEGEIENAEWAELIKPLYALLKPLVQVLDDSILHVLILLKFVPNHDRTKARSKKSIDGLGRDGASSNRDIEKGDGIKPGDIGFGDYLNKKN